MHNDNWRLIITPPAAGAWNMALDEAILESVAAYNSPPTLRLYAWDPPCLSLGYAQPLSDVDIPLLKVKGWDMVRRPTGGRAILHTDELTYSVIAPLDEPRVAGTILESYRRLSAALLAALKLLNLPAVAEKEYALPNGTQLNGAVCFEVPSNYEITVNGKKLIGSAQARRMKGVLQHGSLPLHGDLTRITQVLHYGNEDLRADAARRLLEHAATVEMLRGDSPAWNEAAGAFSQAFKTALGITLAAASPTALELQRTSELVRDKYAHPSWTERV